MLRFAAGVVLAIALAGCGGSGWADADTKSATDAARASLAVEAICGGDGGACAPAQVRALERMSYCANASQVARHGGTVPQATPPIQCQAR